MKKIEVFAARQAIREKLEDRLDAHDLRRAVREATGFHSWRSIKNI